MKAFAELRIGLIGPLPPPAGGMAMQTRQLSTLLQEGGAVATVVQSNAPFRPGWVRHVPILRALARFVPYLIAVWRAAGRSDLFHVMANSGWSWHLVAAPAIWIARSRGVPTIVNYRGGEASAFLERRASLVRFTMSQAAALCVPSPFLEEIFRRHGMAADVIPNVVDLECFKPAVVLARDAKMLVARNLESIYDNATALRAFAIVLRKRPTASLTIAGTGPELASLKALSVELGLGDRVRFVGRQDRQQIAELLRDSSVSINPSRVDNTPNSVLEALASGVPVVSTAVGGVPYLVKHEETALLVSPSDPAAMAEAVLRILDEPALARHLRDAGRRLAQRFAWSEVAPLLAATYRRALHPQQLLSTCIRD